MKTSEAINELATALAKAQGQVQSAVKDKKNSFLKNKYASLDSIWDACRKPLSENGLSITQWPSVDNEHLEMGQLLMHSSGQYIQYDPLKVKLEKINAQGIGIATTYARRYMLASAIGVTADEDNDAQDISSTSLSAKNQPVGKEPPAKKSKTPPIWRPTKKEFFKAAHVNFPGLTDQDLIDELKEAKFEEYNAASAVDMMAALTKNIKTEEMEPDKLPLDISGDEMDSDTQSQDYYAE